MPIKNESSSENPNMKNKENKTMPTEISYEKLSAAQTLETLGADASSGLTPTEAARRLENDGPNELKAKKETPKILKLLGQFNDPLIYILLAATAVSLALGQLTDSIIIVSVVILNGIIGYLQEAKAEKALSALQKLASPHAVVKRGGEVSEIEASQLVCGDIVMLEAGRRIPADLRLTETTNLKIEESALTGESEPVSKDSTFTAEGSEPLGNRINMAYMSTTVTYGRGEGVVVATGMDTQIGMIAQILEDTGKERTPLQKRLADLGKMLGVLTVVICALLFVIAVAQKRDVFDMLLTAISLSVAAIPEGLPAVVTIVLAAGVSRMAKSHSIVRRLPAVETLGAVNVICTDKTGTLTQNKMTVKECYVGAGMKDIADDTIERRRLLESLVLCNDASISGETEVGDPTETALLVLGEKYGIKKAALEAQYPRVDEIPFDSQRKMMSTVHDTGTGRIQYTKGALSSVLRCCDRIYDCGGIRAITDEDRRNIEKTVSGLASQALRVLAAAFSDEITSASEERLVFIGVEGMMDPPRPEAAEAVKVCRKAGITTVMITGDHRDTAFAIAKELGIAKDESEVISGEELDTMTQEELNAAAGHLRVFARVSPENKVAIVKAFKSGDNIVSMTGDGVNDAPSLKSADIGIAMGITGTDVAKGASDMILTDDNFATIPVAIQEGRNIYGNIKKSVMFLLTSNLGEILTMVCAIIAGVSAPLSPVQILWINLVTDSLPALALGMDPGRANIMSDKPRSPKESLFAHGGVAMLVIYGLTIGGATLFGFFEGFSQSGLTEGRTLAMTVLATSQLYHAIGMRDVTRSIFKMNHLSNKLLILAVGLGLGLQLIVVQVPAVCKIFGTQPLTLGQWVLALLLALLPLTVHEIIVGVRFLFNRVKGEKD
jgi:P-type Ca2+ transporter type 2C